MLHGGPVTIAVLAPLQALAFLHPATRPWKPEIRPGPGFEAGEVHLHTGLLKHFDMQVIRQVLQPGNTVDGIGQGGIGRTKAKH